MFSQLKKLFSLIGIVVIITSCSQSTIDEDQVVARVGSEVLLLDDLRERIPEESVYKITIDQIKEYIDHWVNTQLAYQQAYRLGLHNTLADELQSELKRFEIDFLANRLVEREINRKIKISAEEIQKYYESNKEQFTRSTKELRLLHLVTSTSETADVISAELKQKQDIEDLILKFDEQNTLWPNGDMGYIPEAILPSDVSKALARMKTGETSRVVQTDFGYHFFKILDIQPQGSIKSIEEVQNQISEILKVDKRNEAYHAYLVKLKTRAEEQQAIKVNYEALKEFQQDTTNILAK
ncbi:peptidyl-prolyl cis-trans isomerase [candidate division KSB1 bacterium]|nr:peptidyl-prolyl cis-trans isomerase [candidate division KSB1 bacterium]